MSGNGVGAVKIVSLVFTALLFLSLIFVVFSTPFPHAKYRSRELLPIEPADALGGEMSNFLWNFRGFDLMMQTLILFATAISCLALLREEKH
jgi:multisubunit Na+/H+ antiporter MnhB subunit